MNKQLNTFIPLCNSIGKLFYPNVEVVLHDIKTQKLVHITNAFSKREIGDKMINDVKDIDLLTQDIVGPYSKTNSDGSKLKTVSTILRDVDNKAIGIICINFKIEVFNSIYQNLKDFLNIQEPKEKPQALFSQDWQEHTLSTINTYLKIHSLKLEELKIKDKKELIIYLNDEGIFSIRNVVSYLCKILDISRATIYKYLKECK